MCIRDRTILFNPPGAAEKAWREAVAVANKDWHALETSRQQLLILRDLEFRTQNVETALAVLDEEIASLEAPWQARRVFLFSGHMIDTPDRAEPRFPASQEKTAAAAIAAKLDELGMGEGGERARQYCTPGVASGYRPVNLIVDPDVTFCLLYTSRCV